jgi:hypothetical protein
LCNVARHGRLTASSGYSCDRASYTPLWVPTGISLSFHYHSMPDLDRRQTGVFQCAFCVLNFPSRENSWTLQPWRRSDACAASSGKFCKIKVDLLLTRRLYPTGITEHAVPSYSRCLAHRQCFIWFAKRIYYSEVHSKQVSFRGVPGQFQCCFKGMVLLADLSRNRACGIKFFLPHYLQECQQADHQAGFGKLITG